MAIIPLIPSPVNSNEYIVLAEQDTCILCDTPVNRDDLINDRCTACRTALWTNQQATIRADIAAGKRCEICALPFDAEDIGRERCEDCRRDA